MMEGIIKIKESKRKYSRKLSILSTRKRQCQLRKR
jgi:hypothetical protein